jgi:hypothetical protein
MSMPVHEQERLLGLRNARIIAAHPDKLSAHRRGEKARASALKREQVAEAMQRLAEMTGGSRG